jgi:hypothetical protein
MATYKLLDSYTVGAGGVASVTFSNVNQTYTDLIIKGSFRSDNATANNAGAFIRFNGDSSANAYPALWISGNGSAASSSSNSTATFMPLNGYGGLDTAGNTANTFSSFNYTIPNYTNSNYKPLSSDWVGEDNSTSANAGFDAGIWNNTAPITSITIYFGGQNAVQYSTFELYGISNQPATAAPAGTTTIGTAYSSGNTSANVPFTYSGTDASYYVATSSPGGLTATGTTSPLTVTGLTTGTAYTFTVKPYNFAYGPGTASSASNSVTVAGDFVAIATATVDASGASSVTFSNIPQGYKHLELRCNAQINTGAEAILMQLNGDTGNNYALHFLYGSGSAAGGSASTSRASLGLYWDMGVPAISNVFAPNITSITDYSNTNKYKTLRALDGYDANGSGAVELISGLWQSTAAVTSITLTPNSAKSFTQYSTFELYGVN